MDELERSLFEENKQNRHVIGTHTYVYPTEWTTFKSIFFSCPLCAYTNRYIDFFVIKNKSASMVVPTCGVRHFTVIANTWGKRRPAKMVPLQFPIAITALYNQSQNT